MEKTNNIVGRKAWIIPHTTVGISKIGLMDDFVPIGYFHQVPDFFGRVTEVDVVSMCCDNPPSVLVESGGTIYKTELNRLVFDKAKVHNVEYIFKRDDLSFESKLDICFKEAKWWNDNMVRQVCVDANISLNKKINNISKTVVYKSYNKPNRYRPLP